jgi:hypothetical protein
MKWSAAGALADWVEPSRSTSSCATWLPPPRIIAIAAAAPPSGAHRHHARGGPGVDRVARDVCVPCCDSAGTAGQRNAAGRDRDRGEMDFFIRGSSPVCARRAARL